MSVTHYSTMDLSFSTNEIKNCVKTFTASKRFVKSICRVVLLNVLYHRLHIDEKEFTEKKYEGIPFKMFKRKSIDPTIRDYHAWINGILDAIDQNFLKNVFLFLKDKDTDDILETYKLHLQYNKTNNVVVQKSGEEQIDITKAVLKFLLKMGNCPKLNENVIPLLELSYCEDTPEEYEPPNFQRSSRLSEKELLEQENLIFINLNTGFHKLKAIAQGELLSELNKNDETIDEANSSAIDIISDQLDARSVDTLSITDLDRSVRKMGSISDMSISNADIADNSMLLMEDENTSGLKGDVIQCCCKLNIEIIPVHVVTCVKCRAKAHGPCQGYLNELSTEEYICYDCSPNFDNILEKVTKQEKMLVAQTRLAIAITHLTNSYPKEFLSIIEKQDREILLSKLESIGLLKKSDDEVGYEVLASILQYIIPYFFPTSISSERLE